MARLHGDGFDHYGSSLVNMLDGEYASANGDETALSTSFPMTGTHALLVGRTGLTQFNGLRKILPSAIDKLGAAAHFYFPSIPTEAYAAGIFHFLPVTGTDNSHVSVVVGNNGELHFIRNSQIYQNSSFITDGTLIASSDPVVTAASHNHIEVQIYLHDTAGWIRAAVNGVHVFEATGLDTKRNSENCAAVAQNRSYLSENSSRFHMDNYHIYDFTGDSGVDTDWCPTTDGTGKATNYIGELQAMYQVPDADTAETDWGASTGSDVYAMIDETTPNDADYAYSADEGDLSEFTLTDLPEEITYIRGLDIVGRMSKADAGSAMVKFGMKSVADTIDSAEFPVTTEANYWRKQANIDPDSSARWTRASFNAAWLRLIRSA